MAGLRISALTLLLLCAAAQEARAAGRGTGPEDRPQGGRNDTNASPGGPLGQGPGGRDDPGLQAWLALNCTTPLELLNEEAATYATFLKLVADLNLTRLFSMPVLGDEVRAPSNAFFTAWLKEAGQSSLPLVSNLTAQELRALQRGVAGLLVPRDAFNHTGHGGGLDGPQGGPWDDNGADYFSRPGGPGSNGPNSQQGPTGNNNGPQDPQQGGPQGNDGQRGGTQQGNSAQQAGPQGNGGQQGGPQGNGVPQGGPGRNLKHSTGGPDGAGAGRGHGPGGLPLPTTCPDVALTEVDTPVDGSAACSLGACLPCAGVAGCSCVDCRCSCS